MKKIIIKLIFAAFFFNFINTVEAFNPGEKYGMNKKEELIHFSANSERAEVSPKKNLKELIKKKDITTSGSSKIREFARKQGSRKGSNKTNLGLLPEFKLKANLLTNNVFISEPLKEGGDILFSSTIENKGSKDAGTFAGHFYIDLNSDGYDPKTDVVLGERINYLKKGESFQFKKSWKAIEGTHAVRVYADGLNEERESNESDNSSEWFSFTVESSTPQKENSYGVYGRGWRDYLISEENNFNLIIYQYAKTDLPDKDRVDEIFNLLNSGNHVIVNLYLKDNRKNSQKEISYLSEDEFLNRLGLILEDERIKNINKEISFTIGEENSNTQSVKNPTKINGYEIYSYLDHIYKRAKEKYPEYSYMQWYTPRCKFIHQFKGNSGYSSRVPYTKNDGWVYDQYIYGVKEYNKITSLYSDDTKKNNNDLYSLIWASPDLPMITSDDLDCSSRSKTDLSKIYSEKDWWNNVGWKSFYNNVAKNKEKGIPTLFYMFTKNSVNGTNTTLFSKNAKQCHKDFLSHLNKVTIPYLQKNTIPLGIPKNRPSWIPSFYYENCK